MIGSVIEEIVPPQKLQAYSECSLHDMIKYNGMGCSIFKLREFAQNMLSLKGTDSILASLTIQIAAHGV